MSSDVGKLLSVIMATNIANGDETFMGLRHPIFPERVKKSCTNCGKEHYHNNTCCSAKCFKESSP